MSFKNLAAGAQSFGDTRVIHIAFGNQVGNMYLYRITKIYTNDKRMETVQILKDNIVQVFKFRRVQESHHAAVME